MKKLIPERPSKEAIREGWIGAVEAFKKHQAGDPDALLNFLKSQKAKVQAEKEKNALAEYRDKD